MKYKLLILFLSVTSIASAQKVFEVTKQPLFRFGIKAGVNANKISGQSYKDGFKYNFQAGVFGQIKLTRKIGLQPEISFVQTQQEFTNDANTIYDDLFLGGDQHKAKLDYLEIPLLLNINLGPTNKVKFQIGPSYGALLKQTIDSVKNNGNLYKNGEFSAISGIWIQLPFVNISARYKVGLSNINAIDDREKWKNQAIQVGVGIAL